MTERRRRLRRVALRTHRWLSVTLGIWMVAMAVTGTVLVVLEEANAMARPSAYRSTPGDRGPVAVVASVLDARPGSQLTRLTAPVESNGVYRVDVVDRRGVERRFTVDPGSARLGGEVTEEVPLLRAVRRLHTGLLRDSWWGVTGERVVCTLGLAWLVSLLAGAWTWWWPRRRVPRIRRTRSRGPRRRHRALAAWTAIPLLIIVVTGVSFQYEGAARWLWEVVTLGQAEARTTAARPVAVGAERRPWSEVLDTARALVDDGRLLTVEVPRSPTAPYRVRFQLGNSRLGLVSGRRVVVVDVDPYSGAVTGVVDPLTDGSATQVFEDWRLPLHTGTFGGPVSRVVWFLIGALLVATAWTGWSAWRRRRRDRVRT